MGKVFLSILFLCLLDPAWADIRIFNNDIYMQSTNCPSTKVFVTDDNSDSAPWAYIPMAPEAGAAEQEENSLYNNIPYLDGDSGSLATLFVNSPLIGITVQNTGTVTMRVSVYTKFAGNTFRPVIPEGTGALKYKEIGAGAIDTIYFKVERLCSDSNNNCFTTFNTLATTNTTSINTEQYIYIHGYPTTTSVPDPLEDPVGSDAEGFRAKLLFSTKVPTPSFPPIVIKRGDTNLTLEYDGTAVDMASSESAYKAILVNSSVAINAETNFQDVVGASAPICALDEVRPGSCYILGPNNNLSGAITAYNLVNDNDYHLGIVLSNRFFFTTKVARTLTARPQEIQTFLKEQSCFFLSAGFQEKHFVLDYFRHFRDTVLLAHNLGQSFVTSYYELAPQYTHHIYNSPVISSLMRFLGHSLYWVFTAFWTIASFVSALVVHRFFKRLHT